jgi:hypothetical protein
MHTDPHPLAGQTIKVDFGTTGGNIQGVQEYCVEDWWDRLTGGSWMQADGNPAAVMSTGSPATPERMAYNEVVYGKVGAFGHLAHVSEIVQ